jgi:preprotein translocase subunit SecG
MTARSIRFAVMRRLRMALPIAIAVLLLLAPAALGFDGGQGTYGPADDKVVTKAGFIVIAFFPLLALVLTLLQSRLERRKERRKAARKRLAKDEAAWRGGW